MYIRYIPDRLVLPGMHATEWSNDMTCVHLPLSTIPLSRTPDGTFNNRVNFKSVGNPNFRNGI